MIGGAFNISVTDLFIAATASLLVILALSRPNPPIDLPVQADLVASCAIHEAGEPEALVMRLADSSAETEAIARIHDSDELSDFAAHPELPPRLLYVIALVPAEDGTLAASCLQWARDDIVRTHNAAERVRSDRNPTAQPDPAIFALVPALPNPSQMETP